MAILTGFPAANTISPSVRIQEQDNTFLTTTPSFHVAAFVGFASKGPINIPTLISSTAQLATIFGNPHPQTGDPYLIYAAQQYLQASNQCWIVRVAQTSPVNNEAAATATVNVPVSGTQIVVQSDCLGPYVFANDSFFSWSLNGVQASKVLVVLEGTYTTVELVAALNAQIDPVNDGIYFQDNSGYFAVLTEFAYGPNSSLELISVQNYAYATMCIGTGMTVATTTGSETKYPNNGYQTSGNYDFTGLTGLNLQVVVTGTQNVLIDNVVQVIDLSSLEGMNNTIGAIVTAINAQIGTGAGQLPGGWIASNVGGALSFSTLTTGEGAQILIKSASTAFGIFGFSGITASGTSPEGVSGDFAVSTYGIITGAADSSEVCFTCNADSPGIDGNSTQIVVTNNPHAPVFSINVYNNGVQVEAFGNLSKNPASTFYLETYISVASNYISIVDNTLTLATPLNGTYSLSGGSDGIPSDPDDQDTLLIGNSVAYTGIYAVSNPETIVLDLIAVPGHSSTAVVLAMLNLCQNVRQDCMALVDPPFGLTVQEIIQWQNGTYPLNNVQFDSDFGALYWPWLKQYDNFNDVYVWVPPSGSVAAVYANSDNLSAPWYAPAGLQRGVVSGITDVFSRPTLPERDLMYGNTNCINPIITFSDISGFVVWGQKTLQREQSALTRVNVRRMLLYCEKTISTACRALLFNPNDSQFVTAFEQAVKAILNEVQVGQGLAAYTIDDGPDLNTQAVIDQNIFRANIGIQYIPDVEFIFLEFSLNNSLPTT